MSASPCPWTPECWWNGIMSGTTMVTEMEVMPGSCSTISSHQDWSRYSCSRCPMHQPQRPTLRPTRRTTGTYWYMGYNWKRPPWKWQQLILTNTDTYSWHFHFPFLPGMALPALQSKGSESQGQDQDEASEASGVAKSECHLQVSLLGTPLTSLQSSSCTVSHLPTWNYR